MEKPKISDIVKNFTEKNYENTKIILKSLKRLGDEYASLEDMATPDRLEQIKREMGSNLTSLTTYYSKIRAYKSNHEYLEEARKQIKSDTVKLVIDRDKVSSAAAEKVVYSEDFYKERVELMQDLKIFFYLVELNYQRYSDTLMHIYQSISQLAAEKRMMN